MATKDERMAAYLSGCQDNFPELRERFARLRTLWADRLWHEVTLELLDLITAEPLQFGTHLIELYEQFVSDFERKLNPLSLMRIASAVARQYTKLDSALEFLERVSGLAAGTSALVVALAERADVKLRQEEPEAAKALLSQAEELVRDMTVMDPVIHGSFYRVCGNADKAAGRHSAYFKHSLLYLACVDVATLAADEAEELAYELGLAALLADDIYNFGELLAHPVISALQTGTHEWMYTLLHTFNAGNVKDYDAQVKQFSSQLAAESRLAHKEDELRRKACILGFVEMLFTRPPHAREATFAEVSAEVGVPEDAVEVLVMRAMSLGLVRGSIDEVDGKVFATWVQPRVLDNAQLAVVAERLGEWVGKVDETLALVENQTAGII